MLMLKNISCLLTIIILILQHNAGMIEDFSGIVCMIILTSLGICFSCVTMKVRLGVAWYGYLQDVKIGQTAENM